MATAEQISSLVQQLPALDVAPADPKEKPKSGHRTEKGKLTGPPWPDAAKLYDQILEGGKESVTLLIGILPDHDTTEDHKPRYALFGIAAYVCRPGKEKQRAEVIAALAAAIPTAKGKNTAAFLIRTLQICGDPSSLPVLAGLLKDPELVDPAAQAMVSLGGNAAELLRAAMPQADGRCRLAIVQALGALRDAAALDGLIQAAEVSDVDVRITALWALARLASPKAAQAAIKASTGGEGWSRIQATKAALALADALAAAGNKNEAALIYQHLRDTRTDPKDAYIRDLAQAALAELR